MISFIIRTRESVRFAVFNRNAADILPIQTKLNVISIQEIVAISKNKRNDKVLNFQEKVNYKQNTNSIKREINCLL